MSCPVLLQFSNTPLRKLVPIITPNFGVSITQGRLNAIMDQYPNAIQQEVGKHLYYRIGQELAAREEWNTMTFLHHLHHARVQGWLGPNQPFQGIEWQLRLRVASEARQEETKETMPQSRPRYDSTTDSDSQTSRSDSDSESESDKNNKNPIIVTKNGTKMRY
jgi:hypothetical protein